MTVDSWTPTRIGEIAREVSNKSQGGEEVLSCTKHRGFVPSLEYFGKQVFSKKTSNYKLVKRGQFAYATIHLDEGSIDSLTIRDEGIISPMYTVFDVDESRVDRSFLLELLRTPMMLNRYQAIGQGSVDRRKSISFDTLAMETLQLPPLAEQKKIAAILSSVDEAIQATEAVIEQTRRVKDGLLQDLLARGIGHTQFKQTEIGEIPESWEVLRMSEVSKVVRGGSPRPAGDPEYFDGDFIPWVTVGEVTKDDGIYLTSTSTMLTEAGSERSRILDEGTLVLTNSGATLGQPKILSLTGCANDGIAAFLHLSPEADKHFLYYYLTSQTSYLRDVVAPGLGQPNLNTTIIGNLAFPFPPLDEQQTIVSRLRALDSSISESLTPLQGLRKIKVGLLQDLLTGAVRVSP